MPWTVSVPETVKLERAGQVVGAELVLTRPDAERDADPVDHRGRIVMRYTRQAGQSAAAFRTMLIGGGTVAAPQGEVGAWLAHLNRAADTATPL